MGSEEFNLEAVFAARRAEFGDMRMDTETAPEETGGEETQGSEETTGINPSWNEILSVLPDSLHGTVMPTLKKWDENYNSGVQKVHSQYEPYKAFIDAGYDPETIEYSLGVLAKLEEDPKAIYEALLANNPDWAAAVEQGQSEEQYEENQPPDDPRIARAEEMSQAVAEWVLEQHEIQEAAAADQELDQEISDLHTKHGDFDEQYVMGLMLTGASAEQAVQQYMDLTNQILTKPRANDSAPVVMGSGGGLPSGAVKVSQLDENARRKLVADMLRQASQA